MKLTAEKSLVQIFSRLRFITTLAGALFLNFACKTPNFSANSDSNISSADQNKYGENRRDLTKLHTNIDILISAISAAMTETNGLKIRCGTPGWRGLFFSYIDGTNLVLDLGTIEGASPAFLPFRIKLNLDAYYRQVKLTFINNKETGLDGDGKIIMSYLISNDAVKAIYGGNSITIDETNYQNSQLTSVRRILAHAFNKTFKDSTCMRQMATQIRQDAYDNMILALLKALGGGSDDKVHFVQ